MKKTLWMVAICMVVAATQASVINVTTKSFTFNNPAGGGGNVYTQFVGSVAVGDYVVVMGAANKAPTQTSVTIDHVVGGASFDLVTSGTYNGGNGNSVIYSVYEATVAGNNNRWSITDAADAGVTANFAIYQLRGDVYSNLTIAGSAFLEDADGSYNNGGTNVLNYSFSESLSQGYLIEAGAHTAGTALLTSYPAYTMDSSGGSGGITRFVDSYDSVSGNFWSSEYVHADPGSGDRTVSAGFVIAEVIPEPATLGMISLAGLGLLFIRRRFAI